MCTYVRIYVLYVQYAIVQQNRMLAHVRTYVCTSSPYACTICSHAWVQFPALLAQECMQFWGCTVPRAQLQAMWDLFSIVTVHWECTYICNSIIAVKYTRTYTHLGAAKSLVPAPLLAAAATSSSYLFSCTFIRSSTAVAREHTLKKHTHTHAHKQTYLRTQLSSHEARAGVGKHYPCEPRNTLHVYTDFMLINTV